MQNTQSRQVCKCQTHHFSLKALHKERRSSLNANLLMCRGKQTKAKKSKSNCLSYEGPVLNPDRCYASPAFILPSQKSDYLQSTRYILREHQKRVTEAEQDLEELYVPKPRSKNMYCNVCRENYEEYLDHIRSLSHRMNIRNTQFNGHILELQNKIKNNFAKDLPISSTEGRLREQIEESVQIVGISGKKKIKAEVEQPFTTTLYQLYNPQFNFNTFSLPPNPFYFAQYPYTPYNPYFQNLTSKLLFGGSVHNALNHRLQNSLIGQQCLNYPLFCMPVPTTLTLDVFQQRS